MCRVRYHAIVNKDCVKMRKARQAGNMSIHVTVSARLFGTNLLLDLGAQYDHIRSVPAIHSSQRCQIHGFQPVRECDIVLLSDILLLRIYPDDLLLDLNEAPRCQQITSVHHAG